MAQNVIRRSARYAQIGGVCSGYALSAGHSIILLRILAVLALFCSGGLVGMLYVAAWMIVPGAETGPEGWEQASKEDESLFRDPHNKVFAGVCGALANYFQADVSLVRLLAVFLFLAGGIGIMPYVYAWMVLPLREKSFTSRETKATT